MTRGSGRPRSGHAWATWPLWKVFGSCAVLSIALGAFVALFPLNEAEEGGLGLVIRAYGEPERAYLISPTAIALGVAVALISGGIAIWNWARFTWRSRGAAVVTFSLVFLIVAARGFAHLPASPWLWGTPLVAAYILAWVLPAVGPQIAELLYREQLAPRTRLGRGCLGIALGLGGTAGAIGAGIGLFSSRSGDLAAGYLIASALSAIGAIDVAFVNAWELYSERSALTGRTRGPSDGTR